MNALIRPTSGATLQVWVPTGLVAVLLTLVGLLMVGQMCTVIALFEPMAATFGVLPETLIWTVTAFGLANAVGALIAGPLSDRLGARPVIVGGLAGTALLTALVPAAPDLGVCTALRAMQGFSVAFLVPASFSYVTSQVRPDRRVLVLSCITSGAMASAVIMQAGAQMISEALNWQAVFLICAPLLLLAATAALITLRPSRRDSGPSLADAFIAMPKL